MPSWLSVRSPTSTLSSTVSSPGSETVPLFVAVSASSIVTVSSSASTAGATLFTTSSKLAVVCAPSLSVAVTVTVWLWSGPSLVA